MQAVSKPDSVGLAAGVELESQVLGGRFGRRRNRKK